MGTILFLSLLLRLQSLFGDRLPQGEIEGTMKRLLACLAFCGSLSASAQDDNCTVLGIQDLTMTVLQLQAQVESQEAAIAQLQTQLETQNAPMTRDSVADIAIGTAWRGELSHADLSGAHLGGKILTHYDLSNADLSGADLSNVNAYYTNFSGANLSNTNWQNANLGGANFSDALLTGGYWMAANLSGADLSNAIIDGNLTCLIGGCPVALPSGYVCQPDPNCANRVRIAPQ